MNEVELKLTANIDEATRDVARFSKEYQQMARVIERPLRDVNTFREMQESLEGTQRQLTNVRNRVRDLSGELARATNPSKQLQNEYRAAVAEAKKLERTEGLLTHQLSRRRAELKAAGVDTRNLATEQARLAAEMNKALVAGRSDLAMRDARSALGVGEIENAQRELVELRRQYQLVTKDGNLSATQRAEAETNYRRSVGQSLAQLRTLREATRATGTAAQSAAQVAATAHMSAIQSIRARRVEIQQTAIAERKAALEAAQNNLGVGRYRELQATLASTRSQYDLLRRTGSLTSRELSIAQASVTQRVRETQRAMRELGAQQQRVARGAGVGSGLLGMVGPVAGAYAFARAVQGIATITDEYNQMNARLKLVTDSQEEFNRAQKELERIAEAAQSPVADLVTLYTRIAKPLKDAGREQKDILTITEAVALSFRVSGASAEEARSGVIQFSQALGAGALRGDEFNSVAEQAPRLMQALAEGIGVPVASLREMAKEGRLTTDVIADALRPQLSTLQEEMATLPDAVGASMTGVSDAWNKAIAKADITPLTNALDRLKERLNDPSTAEGLGNIASFFSAVGGFAVGLVPDFLELGDTFGAVGAQAAGSLAEVDRLTNEIRAIEDSLDSSWTPGDLLVRLFFSKEELQAKLAEARSALAEIQGISAEATTQEAESNQVSLEARQKYVEAIKQSQADQLEASKDSLKKLLAEEKKANSELETIRKERLEIQNRYKEALEGLGGGDEASYGAAQSLKVGARKALQDGDVEGAQRQAREALSMLQELEQAGENTYGFAGFIKELEQIDLAANKLQENKAVDELADINSAIVAVKEQAEALKNLDVSVKLDDASLQVARNQLAEFAKSVNGTEIVLPVRTVYSDGTVDVTDIYDRFKNGENLGGFAAGGWTGRGSKYQVAGVVHADEYVQPKSRMREPGALAFMEAFRRRGMALLRNGYAEGGLVAPPRNLPSIPQLSPSLSAAQSAGTPLHLTMPNGQTYELSGQQDVIVELGKAINLMKLKGRKR